jgi:hypothetical protein
VAAKIAPVTEAVTDNTAIINNFVFLFIISTFVSPLKISKVVILRHAKLWELTWLTYNVNPSS